MSGSVWLPPGSRPDALPGIPRQRRRTPSWAQPDPVDELTERLDDFIAAAVHPDEIAALLESDGLSDDQIRERYGVKNSFALAETLYERVERRYPEPAGPPPDPWRIGLLGCLLRGVVFALPGLAYVLGAPLFAGPGDLGLPAGTVPLLAGALCGWTWNQGLAHRAYAWLGLGDRTAARRALLLGAPAGALLGSLVALAFAGSAAPAVVAFAAGQSCYLAAATVLLVMGRERLLLTALAPMATAAVLSLVQPLSEAARLAALLGSLAAVAALAVREVAPALKGEGGWSARLIALLPFGGPGTTAAPRLTGSLPYALFGQATGVLVLYAALGDVLAGEQHSAIAAPAAVALTLSMGPAEWLLHRFRSDSLAGLRSSGTARDFRRTTVLTVLQCLAAYLAALLALSLAASALWPHSPVPGGARLAGLLLLGVVLWTGLLLQSFGAVTAATAVCCAAALAQTLLLVTHTGDPHTAGLIVYGAAAVVQAGLVCALLGRATAHR
ncbi:MULTISPECIES: hypothetical protein [unclassified Streptomyces]|uniref:hypothetical protein n=1 Tax=unclassified Streptomyces TaxID=2593676 RepID=UPI0004BF57BC|nr:MULTISPECIES: hypothetical protein [unclassified Streptomyces]